MKLYIFLTVLFHTFILSQVHGVDAGQAIDSLRQNNAVVGILYFIVLVQAIVIVKLWLKINQLNKERIDDLKERIKAEENLRREIQDVYTRLNIKK